jgi:hypothetical protein
VTQPGPGVRTDELAGTVRPVDKSDVMRWGRAPNGGRHLLHTNPRYVGRPGVTPISMCGVALEIVTMIGAEWYEHEPLACVDCTAARADWISTPWIADEQHDV